MTQLSKHLQTRDMGIETFPTQGLFQTQSNHSNAGERKIRYVLEAGQTRVLEQRNQSWEIMLMFA